MSAPPARDPPDAARRARGFQRAGRLVAPKLAAAAKKRGFLETRLLTEWEAIVGPEIAAATRPVKMTRPRTATGSAARGGTLTVQADGARAPEVQMMLPTLKARVNAALGWPAVAQVRLVQAWGFAEDAAPFGAPPEPAAPQPDAARLAPLVGDVSSIGDDGLRAALETLARNVVSRR
jgi:hypothetical protein